MDFSKNYIIEYSIKQQNFRKNRICGDLFAIKDVEDENSFRIVLCDGMGHGIKANILSNMTSPLVMDFDFKNGDISTLTQTILNIQPICSIRKINHCTYTVVDINKSNETLSIINYDNPNPVVFIKKTLIDPQWSNKIVEEYVTRPKKISFTDIPLQDEILIVIFSDGVTQSGMGKKYPFGWEFKNCVEYIKTIAGNSPKSIATDVIVKSIENDEGLTYDDVSCAVIKITKIDK